MSRILLEVGCPRHGFERFSIKVVKRYNIPSKDILPNFRKLKPDQITQLYVGRNVTEREIQRFLSDYLSRTGMNEILLNMRMIR
ncbi:MAG: hypothetical protein OEY22_10920 [Candidatus Bathyarchaeota archaeon]|nr:hypothetical protein [Candidatus Bathyarchaeota archaeon]MDH5787590.1 hypothetical protein [Candidatus Bathyarchaeota archaeon]